MTLLVDILFWRVRLAFLLDPLLQSRSCRPGGDWRVAMITYLGWSGCEGLRRRKYCPSPLQNSSLELVLPVFGMMGYFLAWISVGFTTPVQ
jgi:hypothetical protein